MPTRWSALRRISSRSAATLRSASRPASSPTTCFSWAARQERTCSRRAGCAWAPCVARASVSAIAAVFGLMLPPPFGGGILLLHLHVVAGLFLEVDGVPEQ